MTDQRLSLRVLPGSFAVARLDANDPLPGWAALGEPGRSMPLLSVTRTQGELSIVCRETLVPVAIRAERGFVAFAITGTLDFSLVGILASLLEPLRQSDVAVLALSTFDTDYLLVRYHDLDRAVAALRSAGFEVTGSVAPPPAPARP
jgi:hypothetical protein